MSIANPRVHDHSPTRLLSRIAESRVHEFALGTYRSVILNLNSHSEILCPPHALIQ